MSPKRRAKKAVARLAVEDIDAVLTVEQHGGMRGKTAEALGVDIKTLAKWLSTTDDDGLA